MAATSGGKDKPSSGAAGATPEPSGGGGAGLPSKKHGRRSGKGRENEEPKKKG